MLVKVVLLFLLGMFVIAMLGNLLFPGTLRTRLKKRLLPGKTGTCLRCGRPKIGRDCDCGTKG